MHIVSVSQTHQYCFTEIDREVVDLLGCFIVLCELVLTKQSIQNQTLVFFHLGGLIVQLILIHHYESHKNVCFF